MLREFNDIHTHRQDAGADAVIQHEHGATMRPDAFYSVGVHPWDSAAPDLDARFDEVRSLATLPQVVMIGECGIDNVRGASMEVQTQLLRRHALLAEQVGKPLLLHVVGAYQQVIALHKQLHPAQTWIVHGFRGKPQLADQLLRHGFSLSLGQHFNPHTARIIPDHRLYFETDTAPIDISHIHNAIISTRNNVSHTR